MPLIGTDYRKLVKERRPLAMKLVESSMGMSMENVIVQLFERYRSIMKVSQVLDIPEPTLRRWTNDLGIFFCRRCSRRTGDLFAHLDKCTGCDRLFCDSCMETESEWWKITEKIPRSQLAITCPGQLILPKRENT